MATYSIFDLQKLPETEPAPMYHEFGLARCTATCRDSCGFTCGGGSCGHTVGLVAEAASGVSDEALRKAQAAFQTPEQK